ncbi:MAG: hypothetical protein DRP11_04500 [Candidatus Aenigmatarchaeota archaeon]|nr:MAG: hypothetical protein DRP11_04500 [Candidatus Aenigmarchaeota archaeon]
MKYIRDTLYGFIKLDGRFIDLMDTPEFQRLRRVTQLGFTPIVYPTATHTRFEHSLGVFHLACEMRKKFDTGDDFLAAALLHDLGHVPFSHAAEWIMKSAIGKNHVDITVERIKSMEGVLERNGFDVKKVCELIRGKGKYGQLLSGDIDIDRMDYLVRDSYYTGVAYGVINPDSVIRRLRFRGNVLGVNLSDIHVVESLLVARSWMMPAVYLHKTTRIANSMFSRGLIELMEHLDMEEFSEGDEHDAVRIFRDSCGLPSELWKRIENRNLYKEGLRLTRKDFSSREIGKVIKLRADPLRFRDIENRIAEELGLNEGEVLLNIPEKPVFMESNLMVLDENKKLEKISKIVSGIVESEWNYWYVGVYSRKERRKLIGRNRERIKELILHG